MNQPTTWEMPLFNHLTGEEKYVAQLVWEYRRHFEPQQPRRVWHYTSLENFKNILNSQLLWFTHISSLADIAEVARVAEMARAAIGATLMSEGVDSRVATMLRGLRSGLLEDRSESTWYTASFTEQADSEMHWAAVYGDFYKGVGIEFDAMELLKFLSPGPDNRLMMGPIIYDTQSTLDFLSKLIVFAIDNFCHDYHEVEDDHDASNLFINSWGRLASVFSILSKQEKFAEECEWRLARQWPWSAQNPEQVVKNSKLYWPTGRGEESDSKSNLLPITRVLVGFAAQSGLEAEVDNLMLGKGYGHPMADRSKVTPRAA
jgi:Protein of unknown function (DUF2971)